eukprot:TRINITY_DN10700_c0_g1_i1.p1 TRINITY_DN10700_c0_g1~~TRINITY_DN10700_c0_g1_i1.p1  ORF type:complete len:537 (+),score=68.17 TRINITY_DN10700_c0_g1_i1:56-1666(+)
MNKAISYFYALLFLLAWMIRTVDASQCIQYDGEVCKGISENSIFLASGVDLSAIESSLVSIKDSVHHISYTSVSCYQRLLQYHCSVNLPSCLESEAGVRGLSMCKSQCLDIADDCQSLFSLTGYQLDCNSTLLMTEPDCYNVTSLIQDIPNCPDEEILVRAQPFSRCEQKCDPSYYTKEQTELMDVHDHAMSWISLGSSCIVLVTWILFPQKRAFPVNMVAYLAFCSIGIAIGLLMKLFPANKISCIDSVTRADASVTLCFLQGVILHYFPIALALWWLCMAFNLHQIVVLENKSAIRLLRFYHYVSWGIPALLVSVASFTESYAYRTDAFTICTLNTTEKITYYYLIWFLAIGSIGLVLILHVSIRVYQSFKAVSSSRKAASRNLKTQLRTFIFLLYYYAIYFSLLILTYTYRSNKEDIEDGVDSYVKCLFGFLEYQDGGECSYKEVIPYSMVFAVTTIINGQGLLLFLTFMTTTDTYSLWRHFLRTGQTRITLGYSQHSSDKARSTQKMSARLARIFRSTSDNHSVEMDTLEMS